VAGKAGAFYGKPEQLGIQIAGILTTMVFSFIMTLIILVPLDLLLKAATGRGMRVTEQAEDMGLDLSEHGESMVSSRHQPSTFDASKAITTAEDNAIPLATPNNKTQYRRVEADSSLTSSVSIVEPFQITDTVEVTNTH